MGLCARVLVVIGALLPPLGATTITILPATTITQATAERDAWLVANFGPGTIADPVDVDIEHGKDVRSLLTSFHSLFFFMTGVDGNVQIRTADGTKAIVHGGDDGLYFIGITSSTAIESIEWRGHSDFGLQDFGIPRETAPAPELTTYLAVASGLMLLVFSKQRARLIGRNGEKSFRRVHSSAGIETHSLLHQLHRGSGDR